MRSPGGRHPAQVSKETYFIGKTDLIQRQKRPTTIGIPFGPTAGRGRTRRSWLCHRRFPCSCCCAARPSPRTPAPSPPPHLSRRAGLCATPSTGPANAVSSSACSGHTPTVRMRATPPSQGGPWLRLWTKPRVLAPPDRPTRRPSRRARRRARGDQFAVRPPPALLAHDTSAPRREGHGGGVRSAPRAQQGGPRSAGPAAAGRRQAAHRGAASQPVIPLVEHCCTKMRGTRAHLARRRRGCVLRAVRRRASEGRGTHRQENSQPSSALHPPFVFSVRVPPSQIIITRWLGLAPATLGFWVRFPNERNQGKQAHPVLKYRVPHGCHLFQRHLWSFCGAWVWV